MVWKFRIRKNIKVINSNIKRAKRWQGVVSSLNEIPSRDGPVRKSLRLFWTFRTTFEPNPESDGFHLNSNRDVSDRIHLDREPDRLQCVTGIVRLSVTDGSPSIVWDLSLRVGGTYYIFVRCMINGQQGQSDRTPVKKNVNGTQRNENAKTQIGFSPRKR